MGKINTITQDEKDKIFNFIAEYFKNFILIGTLKSDIPITLMGGNEKNFLDTKASLTFAMKKDNFMAQVIKDVVEAYDNTPSYDEAIKSIKKKHNG